MSGKLDLAYPERVLEDEAIAIRKQCDTIKDEAFKRDSIKRAEGCELGAKIMKLYREFETTPLATKRPPPPPPEDSNGIMSSKFNWRSLLP